ncbi:MAG: hypothetical protein UW37_C0002G0012 [Candidatus Gottesmanbacteria bacterium GW2011_GWA2_44_17]|uniref:Uncharacterized protein n=3 Tax=Candidatus Gottesmaniibacteriota TaxID=1752720 RepID=A0A0G1IPI3_9BACT|nr:MAG: hypothetical protein UV63_C0007G0023 [Microgenomates group bacterium GW2011_GWC1_43_11]KKT38320.1 MAG: hypothetical protein UW22_C0011G0011 [Candidatus Gottesmanbacteria bacterium GW2011_GWB1_44_11c]KKT47917.1 MAG: hypothetical protein UW37_C0002G0012 [Candidatus Gottesmanbacteria bacterium GW2011_GWA2_44_17]KKT61075.1 MAG: hypothetical protein UW52_C0011G0011 [Candidatus Gottesmanbacteria bacterium GW2011_GWA1_44_24b]HCM82571.1 hypothetical protein [Patescibacteria group bacterium]
MDKEEKLKSLYEKLDLYETKLGRKMKGYRGVIHESAMSEMRHQEVMVLKAMVASLKSEIEQLEGLL